MALMVAFLGADICVIKTSDKLCDVTGLGDAKVLNLKMGTCAAKITLSGGWHIIGIFHQYAIYGHGKSLHAPNQHRAFDHKDMTSPSYLVVHNKPHFPMVQKFLSAPMVEIPT